MRRKTRRRRGFTLIEVLLVLMILVILGSFATMYILGAQKKALRRAAQVQVLAFKECIESYQVDFTRPPSSLQSLIERPSDLPNPEKWQSRYLDATRIPLDPWDQEYQYEVLDEETFRVWSVGPDGVDNTEDDISSDMF